MSRRTKFALIPCKSCRKDVSPRYRVCPHCGDRRRRWGPILKWSAGLLSALFIGVVVAQGGLLVAAPNQHSAGTQVQLGEILYRVESSRWTHDDASGHRLLVTLRVENIADSRRAVPEVTVVDDQGIRYWADGIGLANAGIVGMLLASESSRLNPGTYQVRQMSFPLPNRCRTGGLSLYLRGQAFSPHRAALGLAPEN